MVIVVVIMTKINLIQLMPIFAVIVD